MAVNVQRKFLGLAPFHPPAMTMKYYSRIPHSCVNSRIKDEFILSVVTHDRVEGLVGLQVFASDGEQQVFTFTQIKQASRAGHWWQCPPVRRKTIKLDQMEENYNDKSPKSSLT